jgi:hypothetical protein
MRLGWIAALKIAAWLSPVLIFRLPPIDRLEPQAREDALNALSKSRIYLLRQVMLLLRAVVGFGWGATPEVRRKVGYDAN